MKVLLLDVCHTLFRTNTTFGFLDDYFQGDERYQAIAANRRSIGSRLVNSFSSIDQPKQQALALLKGISEAELRAAAAQYANGLTKISETHDYLQTQRQAGAKVYLLSASVDIVVEPIASTLEVDGAFSSVLRFDNGVCEGVLSEDLSGKKLKVIQNHFGEDDV